MRNILAHVQQKEKDSFAAQLKEIWLAPSAELARQRAKQLAERYEKRFPKAIEILAGAAEQRNPPQDKRRWNLSQSGFLPSAGDDLPYGICRGLVCLQSVFKWRSQEPCRV